MDKNGNSAAEPPSTANEESSLVFYVNGERFQVPQPDPSTTLLEFLRSSTRFKSVKLGCGEGLCMIMCESIIAKLSGKVHRV